MRFIIKLLKHKKIMSAIAVLYVVVPFFLNIYMFNLMEERLVNKIKSSKDEAVDLATSQCASDNMIVNAKVYSLLDDIRTDVSSLQYETKQLDEETVYLSNEQKSIKDAIAILYKRRRK